MDRKLVLKKAISAGIVLCLIAVLLLNCESKEQLQGELQRAWVQTNTYQIGHYLHRFFYIGEEKRLEDHYQRKEGNYSRNAENEHLQLLQLEPDFEKYTISKRKNKNGETVFQLKATKETLDELRLQCITNFYIMEEKAIEYNGITGYFFDEEEFKKNAFSRLFEESLYTKAEYTYTINKNGDIVKIEYETIQLIPAPGDGVSISELSQQDIRHLTKEGTHELRQLKLSQLSK